VVAAPGFDVIAEDTDRAGVRCALHDHGLFGG
jgi:hypothetical protein